MNLLQRAVCVWRYWKYSHPRPNTFRFFNYYLLRSLGLTHCFVIRYQDCLFRLYPSPLLAQLWYHGDKWHSTNEILFLKQIIRSGETFIDVGANVGTHSICVAKHLGPDSTVHAFEPHPQTYQRLQKNVEMNHLSNIKLYNVAIGEVEGVVHFTSLRQDNINRVNFRGDAGKSLPVPQRRLDSFDFGDQPISVLKVDVEGYEIFVFRGAESLLPNVQCLFFEVAEAHFQYFGYTVADLLTYLAQQGWILFRFYEPQALQPIQPLYQIDRVENLVAVRSIHFLQERLMGSPYRILEP